MPIELRKIDAIERPVLERLFQYYLYDLSQFADWSVSGDGTFAYPSDLLSPYWAQTDHHPYFITRQGEIAGFSLVRRAPDTDQTWDMGQFFVLRKYRHDGIGRTAFSASVNAHPGQWQVRVLPDNKPAYDFWKRCIARVCDDTPHETTKTYRSIEMAFFSFQAGT
jgi:predicted acetyltransferase